MIRKHLRYQIGHDKRDDDLVKLRTEKLKFRKAKGRLILKPIKGRTEGLRPRAVRWKVGADQRKGKLHKHTCGDMDPTRSSNGDKMSLPPSKDLSCRAVQPSTPVDATTEASARDHYAHDRAEINLEALEGILVEQFNCSAPIATSNDDAVSNEAIKSTGPQQLNNALRRVKPGVLSPDAAPQSGRSLNGSLIDQSPHSTENLLTAKRTTSGRRPEVPGKGTGRSITAQTPLAMPGELLQGPLDCSIEEAQTPQRSVSTMGRSVRMSTTIPETVHQLSGNDLTNKSKSPYGDATSSRAYDRRDAGHRPQGKRLCSQCRRVILGVDSSCTNCLRAAGTNRPYNKSCPPRESDESVRKAQPPCQMNRARETTGSGSRGFIARKTTYQGITASPLPKSHQNIVLHSPCVPETPELVTAKTSKPGMAQVAKAKTSFTQQQSTKPSVPGEKSSIMPGDAHCFAKKTPRMFKPVQMSKRSNQLSPLGNGISPTNEPDLQLTTVQECERSPRRETSPGSIQSDTVNNMNASPKTPASLHFQVNQPSLQRIIIPLASNTKSESPSLSPREDQESGQASKEVTHREQPSGRTEVSERTHPRLGLGKACRIQESPRIDESGRVPDSGGIQGRLGSFITPYEGTDLGGSKRRREDETEFWEALQKQGVRFEDGSCSESDDSIEFPHHVSYMRKDPLRCHPRSSLDLFELAPHLHPKSRTFDIEQKRQDIDARPTRKQRRLDTLYLRQERGEKIHEEVNRQFRPPMVSVRPSENWSLQGLGDWGTERANTRELKETEMTFTDFIGAPAKPMAILTSDGNLAFRDGTKDARGILPRAREKFILTDRSVACEEL